MTVSRRLILAAAPLAVCSLSGGAAAAGIERRAVRDDGLVGEFHFQPGARNAPAVLLLNGSDGGMPSARDAGDLATAGFPTLSLACFKDWNGRPDGVPDSLNEIPLEYVFRALDWMKAQSQVDPRRIVLAGLSRGAELALLVASMRNDVAGVAAFSPSSVVWRGVPSPDAPNAEPRSAWTLAGRPLPFQVDVPDPSQPTRRSFERAAANPEARIAVEDIHGRVLLVSSKADQIWPSDVYADEIAARLRSEGRPPAWNVQFADASHLLMGTGPGMTRLTIPETAFSIDFGGTAEGTALARGDAWRMLKHFIRSL